MIRPMQQSDIPACLAVAAEGWDKRTAQAAQPDFSDAFSNAAWRPFFFVAEVDGLVVGTACYNVSWLCYGVYNLAWVAVKRDYRGRGIGKALVERCLADLRPIADAVMLATNVPDFYRPFGFRDSDNLHTTENLGEYIMVLEISAISRPENAQSQAVCEVDPADLWDRYCKEAPKSGRTPQGAIAFAVDALSRPLRAEDSK